jgi:DNA repair protein RadA/Sms
VASAKAPKTVYACQSCGAQSPKWLGRCADCGAWNSLVEERVAPVALGQAATEARYATPALGPGRSATAQRYADVSLTAVDRIGTGLSELDRVLGGGVVPGSLVLLGGEPGIGKSTLLLQAAAHFAKAVGPVLYASGEESEPQIKARGERLGVGDDPLYLFAETCLERVLEEAVRLKPALLILDSIQTVFSTKLQSAPGSVAQVREAATQLLFAAKGQHVPTFIIGHVTKDGALAGPKVLEHVVDTVLYFEGERHHAHRVVRAVKNRFGAASEVGVFEMTGVGLVPVPNPSALFLAERPVHVAGSAVLCAVEGSRPLLVEVQALVSTSTYGYAKRTANGLDANRVALLLAVLEKRAGLVMSGDDVFANVAGGLSVDEPAVDLAVVAALASSLRGKPVRGQTALFGEVGLAGEVRRATHAALRVREAARLGFTRVLLPRDSVAKADVPPGVTLVEVASVGELLDALFA